MFLPSHSKPGNLRLEASADLPLCSDAFCTADSCSSCHQASRRTGWHYLELEHPVDVVVMSSSIQAPSRSLLRALKATSKQQPCSCARSKRILSQQRRCLSSTIPQQQENSSTAPAASAQPPRWSQTPPAMKAPVRARAERQEKFEVNGDPAKLDAMYTRFLGKTGPKMLSDETKWLAVTHKSFDHARRGFNDRMAFLGTSLRTAVGKE